MKPHKLIIQNFGPYLNETIDFTRMDKFFLICGPTGSGKTFIFDAMMFALYGRVNGTREGQGYISHYSLKGEKPSVFFQFSINGKGFRITRSPAYERPKAKGDGMTREQQSVVLLKQDGDDWKPETGNWTDINKMVERIIKLTAEEFSKIVLLPQGEFQKFLEDDTAGRAAILQKLFPTDLHNRLTETFNEKANTLKRDMKAFEDQIDDRRESLKEKLEDRESPFEAAIEDLRLSLEDQKSETGEQLTSLKEYHSCLTTKISKAKDLIADFTRQDKLKVQFEKIQEAMPAHEKQVMQLARAREAAPLKQEIENLTTREKELAAAKNRLKEKLEALEAAMEQERRHTQHEVPKIKEYEETVKELHSRIKQLEAEVIRGKRLSKLEAEYQELSRENREREKELNEKKQDYESLGEKIAVIKETHEVLTVQTDKLINFEAEKSVLDKMVHKAAEQERKEKQFEKENTSLAEKDAALRKITEELNTASKLLSSLEKKRDESTAATLAAGLKKDSPCPVCGSTHHPSPANRDTPPFTEQEDLETADTRTKELSREQASLRQEMKNISQKITDLSEEIAVLEKEAPESAEEYQKKLSSVSGMIVAVNENRQKISDHLSSREKYSEQLKELDKEIKELRQTVSVTAVKLGGLKSGIATLKEEMTAEKPEKELEDSREKINQLQAHLERIISDQKNLKEQVDKLGAQTGELKKQIEKSEKAFQESEKKLNEAIVKSGFSDRGNILDSYLEEKDIKNLEKLLETFNREKTECGTALSEIWKRLQGKERPDLDNLESELLQQEERVSEAEKKEQELIRKLTIITENLGKIDELTKRKQLLEKESGILFELSRDLSGDNPRHINFPNFILGTYLEQITIRATERLKRMSDDRYSLRMTDEAIRRRGQWGLDLEISDAYNGGVRSVKSLSGGEKFITSLSLAMGLADVIQERAGGIRLESLFIDEGFGSLDEHSLDNALNILDEIRDNRTIGIISHVSELKSRIQSRLEVEKSKMGSTIKTIS